MPLLGYTLNFLFWKKMGLHNDFSWSKTRDAFFRFCPRQYYYQYYGAWGGWDLLSNARTRKIYILKQLTNRAMWVGRRVHQCIETALKNLRRGIAPMPAHQAIDATLAIMREDFANSKRGGYLHNPKTCGFIEHEYNIPVSQGEWKETADHAVKCLNTFYDSTIFNTIRALPAKNWLEIEEFSSFQLDGARVHVVLDFSCRDGDDILIYDWKTGRTDTAHHELQLACYSFYAMDKWETPPDRIKTIEFNLATNKAIPHNLGGVDLKAIRQYMRGSIRDMKLLLEDPDRNIAREERFAFTENEKHCESCKFKKVCTRWSKI